ncbi:MAG: carbohydrate-binding protein [Bacteroidales bacterium]
MRTEYYKYLPPYATTILVLWFMVSCGSEFRTSYTGTPYEDLVYSNGAQIIPGKVQCEYYDFGGEGIAFHDSDSVNSGSGGLNKADGSYLHEFRINEAVDISYTKFQDPAIDNTPFNFVDQEKDQLYVGWTKPGEWAKYTIDVETDGTYQLGLMYTANKNGRISFSVNDLDVSGPVLVPSTFVAEDTVAWRQWHHWNYIGNIAEVQLVKGIQTLTIHTVETGEMNYDFVNFERVRSDK